jgi:hypothetical protein
VRPPALTQVVVVRNSSRPVPATTAAGSARVMTWIGRLYPTMATDAATWTPGRCWIWW